WTACETRVRDLKLRPSAARKKTKSTSCCSTSSNRWPKLYEGKIYRDLSRLSVHRMRAVKPVRAPSAQRLRKSRLKNELKPFSAFCGKPASTNFSACKFTEGFSTGPVTFSGTTT